MDKNNGKDNEIRQENIEDQKSTENKNADSEGNYMTVGMCIGMCLGMAVGQIFFDNVATGLSVGMCLGLAIGISIKKKK